MGFTAAKITISNPEKPEKTKRVSLLVDTGALYSVIPSDILESLKIKPAGKRIFTLASGEHIERRIGGAIYRLDGSFGHAPVVFGEEKDKELLGVTALEAMGLEVDPVTRKLKPTELYLL